MYYIHRKSYKCWHLRWTKYRVFCTSTIRTASSGRSSARRTGAAARRAAASETSPRRCVAALPGTCVWRPCCPFRRRMQSPRRTETVANYYANDNNFIFRPYPTLLVALPFALCVQLVQLIGLGTFDHAADLSAHGPRHRPLVELVAECEGRIGGFLQRYLVLQLSEVRRNARLRPMVRFCATGDDALSENGIQLAGNVGHK